MLNTLVGLLVGAEAREYSAFVNRETGEKRDGGVTYRLHISVGFESAPVEVRCSEGDFFSASKLGRNAAVTVLTEVKADGNRLRVQCKSLTATSTNGALASK